jgi:hypothetical protein
MLTLDGVERGWMDSACIERIGNYVFGYVKERILEI